MHTAHLSTIYAPSQISKESFTVHGHINGTAHHDLLSVHQYINLNYFIGSIILHVVVVVIRVAIGIEPSAANAIIIVVVSDGDA